MNSENLIMPFLDDSQSFTLGFECGKLWSEIGEGLITDDYLFHTANTDQVKLICKTLNISCTINRIDDTWSSLIINPTVV